MTAIVARPPRAESFSSARADVSLLLVVVVSGALLGVLAGLLATGSQPVLALLLPLCFLPVVLWRSPVAGLVLLLAGVVLIEQFGYQVGPRDGALTSRVPLLRSVAPGSGVLPVEVLLAGVLGACVFLCVKERRVLLHRTPLATRLMLLTTAAVFYAVLGAIRGGDLEKVGFELRPFLYLTLAYLASSALLTSRRALRALLWVFVLGSGAKAVYGVVIFLSIRHLHPRPEAVLSHEESFFFGLYFFLTLAAWLFDVRGRLRTVATALLPFVLIADMVNSRRTAWAIIMCGSALLLLVAYASLPERRHVMRRVGLIGAVLAAIYVPAFWSSNGTLAQPARAIRSTIAPDARDEMSNEYRMIENVNLEHNIRATSSTGSGFGIPIDYVIPITDITDISSLILYVPHNGVYWVWMRMGLLGQLLLWLVVAEALLVSSRLARLPDRETAMFGAVVACAVVAWVIMGEKDLGFYWSRLALCMGILLGAVEARTRALDRRAGVTTEMPDALTRASHSVR